MLRPFFTHAFALLLVCSTATAQRTLKLEKLNAGINTPYYDEIAPLVSLDGKTLYFTRLGSPDFERTLVENDEDISSKMSAAEYKSYLSRIYTQLAGRTVRKPFSSAFNQDVWIAKSEGSEFNTLVHPGYPLNNALPNSISSLTPAGNEVIVINQFLQEGGMSKGFSLMRETSENSWTFPEPVSINNYHNSGPDVSMCISADGSVMILSLERYDSRGKSDLYISFRQGFDWSEPKSLGNINSSVRETTPFLSEDNKLLFFASDRRGSNSDIYMVRRKGDNWKNWSRPMRYKSPINSKSDDSRPYFNAETGYLYFTSKRDGSSDIYRVQIAGPNPMFVTISGQILNAETGQPVSAEIHTGFKNSDIRNIYVSEDGKFTIKVPKGGEYSIEARKPGYEGKEETVNYKRSHAYFKTKHLDLRLDPMMVGRKVDLAPIFFAQSTAKILEDSYEELNHLSSFLAENPYINIRISGHTDNLGNKEVLLKLSEDRAKAVKRYLVYKRRINPVRIEAIGMGDTKPVNDNSTEVLRKQNRRVEVEISEITDPEQLGMKEEEKK